MVKFSSPDDNDYVRVITYIAQMVDSASVKVEKNWKREDAHRST